METTWVMTTEALSKLYQCRGFHFCQVLLGVKTLLPVNFINKYNNLIIFYRTRVPEMQIYRNGGQVNQFD